MMKLKDIIGYLDVTSYCRISTVKPNGTDEDPCAYEGSIFDIPWIYLDHYLFNDKNNFEAIGVYIDSNGHPCFDITLCEEFY